MKNEKDKKFYWLRKNEKFWDTKYKIYWKIEELGTG